MRLGTGGGLWLPEARHLAAIREDIDRRPHRIMDALSSPGIRSDFLGNIGIDKGRIVKAFVAQNAATALKTKPRVSRVLVMHT